MPFIHEARNLDVDYVGDHDTRRSTIGYIFSHGATRNNQSLSTTKVKYTSATTAAQESMWPMQLMKDLHQHTYYVVSLHCDKQSAPSDWSRIRCFTQEQNTLKYIITFWRRRYFNNKSCRRQSKLTSRWQTFLPRNSVLQNFQSSRHSLAWPQRKLMLRGTVKHHHHQLN